MSDEIEAGLGDGPGQHRGGRGSVSGLLVGSAGDILLQISKPQATKNVNSVPHAFKLKKMTKNPKLSASRVNDLQNPTLTPLTPRDLMFCL